MGNYKHKSLQMRFVTALLVIGCSAVQLNQPGLPETLPETPGAPEHVANAEESLHHIADVIAEWEDSDPEAAAAATKLTAAVTAGLAANLAETFATADGKTKTKTAAVTTNFAETAATAVDWVTKEKLCAIPYFVKLWSLDCSEPA